MGKKKKKKDKKKTGETGKALNFKSEAEGALRKSRSVTIRIAVRDLETAQRLAERKGLPYQTYMKMLLHQALEKERAAG